MNRSQLVKEVSERTGIQRPIVDSLMEEITGCISEQLGKGDPVTISGFGRFELRPRKARHYVNPKTGVESQLEQDYCVHFRYSRQQKAKLGKPEEK